MPNSKRCTPNVYSTLSGMLICFIDHELIRPKWVYPWDIDLRRRTKGDMFPLYFWTRDGTLFVISDFLLHPALRRCK